MCSSTLFTRRIGRGLFRKLKGLGTFIIALRDQCGCGDPPLGFEGLRLVVRLGLMTRRILGLNFWRFRRHLFARSTW